MSRATIRRRFVRTTHDGKRSDLYGRACDLCGHDVITDDEVIFSPMADMPKFADPARPVMHAECVDELAQVEDPNVERAFKRTRRKLEPAS